MAGRFVCIPNGWDPEDFAGPPPAPAPILTITHAGTLYRSRFPRGVFTVLRALLDERPPLRHRVRVVLLGTMAEDVEDELRAFPYPEVIDARGPLSAAEARGIMRASDILVLQEEADPEIARRSVPSKLYDYLGAERFILALAGPGSIRDTVEETQAGLVIEPTDLARLRAVLLDWLHGRRRDPAGGEEQRQRRLRFSRVEQTALLAGWLDRVGRRTGPQPATSSR
jgi:glycosyltransferase involved in cell wall biosynthesis